MTPRVSTSPTDHVRDRDGKNAVGQRGRVRDPAIDARILAVAHRHLSRVGYEAMSVAAIAEEAQTTRQALYRRWPSKASLASAALAGAEDSGPVIYDHQSRYGISPRNWLISNAASRSRAGSRWSGRCCKTALTRSSERVTKSA